MAKKRFRDIKQGKEQEELPASKITTENEHNYASSGMKIKAFLTDSFMLVMPIMYVVFYFIMDGREGFSEHKALGWLYILIPLVLTQTIFMFKTGQTPGYRAYNIEVIEATSKKRPSLFIIFFRNLCAILSLFTVFGWLMMFVRKDKKTLHDLLSNTIVINKKKIPK